MASALSNKVVIQLSPNREVKGDCLNGMDGTVPFGTFVEDIVFHCNLFFVELVSQRQESIQYCSVQALYDAPSEVGLFLEEQGELSKQ